VSVQLLNEGIEVGIVTANPEAMQHFYQDLLGLELQGELPFPGGTMRRFGIGKSTLKLVSYDEPPPEPVAPGGGRARAGIRFVTLVIAGVRAAAERLEAAGCPIAEPVTEFAPGTGWVFVEDPDGNHVELAGTL
jgi:catechol 2,3-dioxygenase-like lactoylglutathione lyase family enzyme